MSTKLTDTQSAIHAFMVRFQKNTSRPPTLRQIGDEFGIESTNAVRGHVMALARKGFVKDTGDRYYRYAAVMMEAQEDLFSIPLYGVIPAGHPADNPQAEEKVRIDPAAFGLRSAKGLYCLHVRGDSMIGAQIADGDIALLKKAPAEHGQIVAALIDGESTLKRLVRRGRGHFLRAENPRYADIIPAESLDIQGVFVGVIGRGKR